MGKTPSSHIIHSLGGEYCLIVRDSERIRLLKSPRSLSVYLLMKYSFVSITEKPRRGLYHIIPVSSYVLIFALNYSGFLLPYFVFCSYS